MYLIFDTETTGLPKNFNAPVTDGDNWPRMVQLAWQLHDHTGKLLESGNYIVKPDGYSIPFNAAKIHGITTERATAEGIDLAEVLDIFDKVLAKSDYLIGHNIGFDEKIVGAEYFRVRGVEDAMNGHYIDTKNEETTEYCQIPGGRGGNYKWPTLTELHEKLFGEAFDAAHNAAADVEANARAFLECVRLGVIVPPLDLSIYTDPPKSYINRNHYISLKVFEDENTSANLDLSSSIDHSAGLIPAECPPLDDIVFTHLHTHSQNSILMATANVAKMIDVAKEQGMPALAITDLGNLFGAYEFIDKCNAAGIKPIIGCELYLVEDRTKTSFTRDHKDHRNQIILLAKNHQGYKNLSKISTKGYLEGYYYKYPRIDKALIEEYHEGLIALTGGLYGEIPDLILNRGEEAAEEALQWWLALFGDDFYIELCDHGLDEEKHVNEVLLSFAKKYGIKVVATNDFYYLEQKDYAAHDALLCIGNGEIVNTPIGRGRGTRFGFPNDQFYMKSVDEMKKLFSHVPQALYNTQDIVDKVEVFSLKSKDMMLPNFAIPQQYETMDDYLRALTYEGAQKRYPELTDEIKNRIEHELAIMKRMGYAGYFLIVQDFTTEARNRGVYVGPGRGSAAGAVVAYCLGITNIDPIRYDLLFERFLNPERVSPPDIDIDFDDEGRQDVINFVVEKYGRDSVAQIITYGKLKAKSGVRDAGRVLDIPLAEVNRVAKFFPDSPGLDVFRKVLDKGKNPDSADTINQLFEDPDPQIRKMMEYAKTLEGAVRQTGIHAAGVIIAPGDISNYAPLATTKDGGVVTQYDGPTAESAGLLKMDFLGLKTMSILKTCIKLVKRNFDIEYNLDDIPLTDDKTFELYQRGLTIGTFQFESAGMQKYLKELKPSSIDDLIAMNALYRPGPLKFIPDYINRKHGREEVVYDHEMLEPVLKPTYGIMVYQEQIMRVAQVMGGYTLGGADLLRRAMGKKKVDIMEKERIVFIKGAAEKGVDENTAKAVFEKMEYFAGYGFNKSHSAAYSVLAYQTAYFKANYPAEYMAAVMTHNMTNITKVSLFIEECQKIGVPVDPPNINTGEGIFVAVNGRIQYGMAAIKGMGGKVIESIVQERSENGPFESIFDFIQRIDFKSVNKRAIESLITAGAFDSLESNRKKLITGLDDIIAFGQRKQEEKAAGQGNLFGDGSGISSFAQEPKLPEVEPFITMEKLNKERELIGFYLSDHPLNKYRDDLKLFTTHKLHPDDIEQWKDRQSATIGGIITEVKHIRTKKGLPMAFLTIEDLSGSIEVVIRNEQFDRYPGLLMTDTLALIDGEVSMYGGSTKIVARTIERLENVRENYSSNIVVLLEIHTNKLQTEDLKRIASMCEQHKGQAILKMQVYLENEESSVRLNSRKYVVNPTDELIREAKSILGDDSVKLFKK